MPDSHPGARDPAASAAAGEQAALAAAGEQAALAAAYRVGSADVPLWPDGQRIDALSAPLMASTHFADHPQYHGELTATMKVRRARALENFRDHIEEQYAGKEDNL